MGRRKKIIPKPAPPTKVENIATDIKKQNEVFVKEENKTLSVTYENSETVFDSNLNVPSICISCALLHDMCCAMTRNMNESEFIPSSNSIHEFRLMCIDISQCCGKGSPDRTYYDDDESSSSPTGMFWHDRSAKRSPTQTHKETPKEPII